MESSSVAVVLALTLACTGGMFLVISKQIQGRSGMATFALGLALFGLVFAVPAQVDDNASLPLGVLIDAGGHLRCTVSIGMSRPFNDMEQWRNAWSEAEVALQAAKDAGCNCVVHPTTA